MIYALIGCLIIIGFLGFKLSKKIKIDRHELEEYNEEILRAKLAKEMWDKDINEAKEKVKYEKYKLDECKKDLQAALDTYNDVVNNKMKEVDDIIEETSRRRMDQLQETFNESKAKYDLQLREYALQKQTEADAIHESCINSIQSDIEQTKQYLNKLEEQRQRYESILEPIKQYEKERQEKLFYTIQLPEEYKDDIEFLLTTVAAKVQHPDIISKLVWAEYVKPNLDNTFKRIEIKSESGIYKLTSLQNGMSYVGKSTDVKKRIADHFKSSIGIKSIADQAVHHAILKEGFWNWSIEVITYADKEQLNELEKYYIDFFKTQEYGYNKTAGG